MLISMYMKITKIKVRGDQKNVYIFGHWLVFQNA